MTLGADRQAVYAVMASIVAATRGLGPGKSMTKCRVVWYGLGLHR